jgi:hypothetical protein
MSSTQKFEAIGSSNMKHKHLFSLGIIALSACVMNAQVLYEQNFNALASSSTVVPGIGGYGAAENVGGSGWQIQGGNGAGTISLTAGINANGVGGSQALFGTWDTATGLDYTWNQYTYYGVGGAGVGGTLANINVSLDLYMSGSSSATPITLHALQNNGSTELNFVPTLTDGQYTHVTYTLAQATAGGAGVFDPTAGFWFRVSHGAGGFGFDAGNTVQIDNVMISVVPEPATAALAGIGAAAMLIFRRRQS